MDSSRSLIVVGVDGSGHSRLALDWALAEARVHGDGVLLVYAWQYPSAALTHFGGEPLPVFGSHDLEKVAAELLANIAEHATRREPSVTVDTKLVHGHPAAALIEASTDARLLVVGSRGHGGFAGMLLGSVSAACTHHAQCPIVVVPQTMPAPERESS